MTRYLLLPLDSFLALLCLLRESYSFEKKQGILWRNWWLITKGWYNSYTRQHLKQTIKWINIEFLMISDPPRNLVHTPKDYSCSSKIRLLVPATMTTWGKLTWKRLVAKFVVELLFVCSSFLVAGRHGWNFEIHSYSMFLSPLNVDMLVIATVGYSFY